jgi:hypothetical protein
VRNDLRLPLDAKALRRIADMRRSGVPWHWIQKIYGHAENTLKKALRGKK